MHHIPVPKFTLSDGSKVSVNRTADYVKLHIVKKPNPDFKNIEIKTPGESFWVYREVSGDASAAIAGQINDACGDEVSKLFEEILKYKCWIENPSRTIGVRFSDKSIGIGKDTITALNVAFDTPPPLALSRQLSAISAQNLYHQNMSDMVVKALFPITKIDHKIDMFGYCSCVAGVIVNASSDKKWWDDALQKPRSKGSSGAFAIKLLNGLTDILESPKLLGGILPDNAFSKIIADIGADLTTNVEWLDNAIEELPYIPNTFRNTEEHYVGLLIKCGLLNRVPVTDRNSEKDSVFVPSWFAEVLRRNVVDYDVHVRQIKQSKQTHQPNLGDSMPSQEINQATALPDESSTSQIKTVDKWALSFSEDMVKNNGKMDAVGGFQLTGRGDFIDGFSGSSCVVVSKKPIQLDSAAGFEVVQTLAHNQLSVCLLASEATSKLTLVHAIGLEKPSDEIFGKYLNLQNLISTMQELDEFALAKFPLIQNLWLAAYGKDPVTNTLTCGEFAATIAGYKPRAKSWGDICESFEKYLGSYGGGNGLDSRKLSSIGRIPTIAWHFITEALIELDILDDYCSEMVDSYPSHRLTPRGRAMLDYFQSLQNRF